MEIFKLTLQQMLLMFSLILVGFVLRKKSLLPANADIVMSKLETCVLVPALMLYTQLTRCSVQTFTQNSSLLLYGLVLIIIAIGVSYPLSRLMVRNASQSAALAYQRNIYKYALTFGNFGFMGNFIVLGVWGSDVFFQYSLFTFFLNAASTSWGLYVLIPKEQSAGIGANLKKGLLSPPIVALAAGMVIGLTGLARFVPEFLLDALDSAGSCQGPVAMVLAGFVIGGYDFRELLRNRKVYITTALRLIVLPAILMLALLILGTEDAIMTLALIAFATPLGLNTIVYPAAYGGDTKTGASMTMISHVLCVITLPLMYLIFIELL